MATALLAVTSLAACGNEERPSPPSTAPPWIVCGTTLWSGRTGVTVTDATKPGERVAVHTTTGDGSVLALLASRDCERGATIRMDARDAQLQGSVAATDGGTVAELVQPLRRSFTITVEHPRRRPTAVEVDLGDVTSNP